MSLGHWVIGCRAALSRSRLPGLDYTFNPYVGCIHGCVYCYVPDLFRGRFERWPVEVGVKEGVLEKLRHELRRLTPGVVGISTSTDPYQPIEGELKLVRVALQILGEAGFPVSIQTKSPLVLRDIGILKQMRADVGMTITSLSSGFSRRFEPGAPPPRARASAIEEMSRNGIETWIFYGPILHGLNDAEDEMDAIVDLARRTKSRLLYDRVNLKPVLKTRIQKAVSKEEMDRIASADYRVIYSKIAGKCKAAGVRSSTAF